MTALPLKSLSEINKLIANLSNPKPRHNTNPRPMPITSNVIITRDEQMHINAHDGSDDEELQLSSGDFTLTQIVGLVTHEIMLPDEDAVKVLLLCHRCFSDSTQLMDALRKRFFIPVPQAQAQQPWTDAQINDWRSKIQRPIQEKCVMVLEEWITEYYYADFVSQDMVMNDLKLFNQQILACNCKFEVDDGDGWYNQLASRLDVALEAGRQKEIENSKPLISKLQLQLQRNLQNMMSSNDDFESKARKMMLEYTPHKVAEQITLEDFHCFTKIHMREFLNKVWLWKGKKKKESKEVVVHYYPNLQKMIDRFNQIHRYVVLCIVSPRSLETRVRMIHYFIEIAVRLISLNNYFSVMAVFAALDSVQICKLKYAWNRILKQKDNSAKKKFQDLASVCDASNNFHAMRTLVRRSFVKKIHTIPYIGVYLIDLTFVNGGAAKSTQGMFNLKKFQRFCERCKIIEAFQQVPYIADETSVLLRNQDRKEQPENPRRQSPKEQPEKQLIVHDIQLSIMVENDIKYFDKLTIPQVKQKVRTAIELDEKQAGKNERQLVKLQAANKRGRRNIRRNVKRKKAHPLFRRFKK